MLAYHSSSYNELDEALRAKGITSSYRNGNDGFKVWVVENDIHRPATPEETELHIASVDAYHMEEAENDLI